MKTPAHRSSSLRAAAHLLPALCAAVAGCGPSQPDVPPQPAAPPVPVKPGPRPALTLPARAIPNQRATTFVARIGGKALYLVGGERWLVDGQGKIERERAPLGEKLESVMPLSRGAVTAVGWSGSRVFAFEDLLGTPRLLAQAEGSLAHVRPGPGAVLLFGYSSAAALDPATGAEKTGVFPTFPVRDAIFVDDRRGAAYTLVGGIGTTADGGQTWKPLRHKVTAAINYSMYSDGADIYLRETYGNRASKIDVAGGSLGDPQDLPAARPPAPTPVESWIVANGNPVLSAVRNGIDAGKGAGVVAGSGVVARVDLESGAFTETAKYVGSAGECRGATAGKEAYLVCAGTGKRGTGSRLFRVTTDGKLAVEEEKDATFGGSAVPSIVGSPAGGLMVLQGCGDKWGGWCVRQPDGSFSQMDTATVAYIGAAAPLADGRVVSVGVRRSDSKDGGPLLELVASTPRERKVLDELSFPKETTVTATSPEQGADGEVRFVVTEITKGKTEVFLFSHEPGKKGFDRTLIPEAVGASFADGVLVGRRKGDAPLRVSHDHGMSFRDVEMPKGASAVITSLNRLGLLTTSHARVGWEPLPLAAPAPKLEPSFRLKSAIYPGRPSTELTCKTSGTGKNGSILAKSDSEVPSVFDIKPPPKGTRRSTNQIAGSPLDAALHFSIEAKEPPASAPPGTKVNAERWIFRWLDGREIDAKPRSVSGKAPYSEMYSYTRAAWARDGRLLVSLSVAGKNVLVRTKGTGFETVEVASSLLPPSGTPVSFSSDGNLMAYLAGEILVVWKSGETPTPVAMVNARYGVVLGAPSKEGIPVLVVSEPDSYYRVFPLPAAKQAEPVEQQWISASWDGWTRGPSVFGRVIPFCDAKPQGARFSSTSAAPSMATRFVVDGSSPRSVRGVRYEVVSDGQSICLESIAAELWDRASITVKSGASTKQVSLDVIRVAAKGKKADITLAGRPVDKVPLHALSCEASVKP